MPTRCASSGQLTAGQMAFGRTQTLRLGLPCFSFFVVFLSMASGVRADVTFETGPLFLGHAKDLASVMGVGEAASLV